MYTYEKLEYNNLKTTISLLNVIQAASANYNSQRFQNNRYTIVGFQKLSSAFKLSLHSIRYLKHNFLEYKKFTYMSSILPFNIGYNQFFDFVVVSFPKTWIEVNY